MDCSTPGSPVFHYLLKFAQTHVHRVSDATQPFHPLSSPSLPVLNLSQHQGKWPKYWSFSFSISPFNEYPGLVSFRIDCFDLLAVQGTLKKESSPTTQLKSINSLGLSLLYGPSVTSVLDYWKNHIFDYMGPLSAKRCLCFFIHCQGLS